MFCHGAGEAAVHPGCGVYARAYGGNHGSFFFQGNGLRRREHRLFFNALPKECRSKDRAKGAHGQWSCQELFSPRVQGYEILGGLSRLGYHIARWRRRVKGGDSRDEANPLDVAPTVCYPLPQAACALACSK